MEFRNSKEAVEYLKSLEDIIMPPQFTYFNHCALYQSADLKNAHYQSWTNLPLNEVVLNKEMSFKDRDMRITQALEKGSLREAEISYAKLRDSMNFMLRVIMPNANLSVEDKYELGIDDEYQEKLSQEHRGFGTAPHPKLKSGEKLLIFASSTVDEVSGKNIDIFYAIREQDAIMYAKKVSTELEKQDKYNHATLPASRTFDGQYEFNKYTYSISKSKDFSRYEKRWILGESGPVQIADSEFENDYKRSVEHERREIRQKNIKKLEDSLGVQISNMNRNEVVTTSGIRVDAKPKTVERLMNDREELKYKIDYMYHSGKFAASYKDGLIKSLNEIYDEWETIAKERDQKDSIDDKVASTSTPPQAIPIKERVIHPTGSKEVIEVKKQVTSEEYSIQRATQNPDLAKLAKQKQDLIQQKEELINRGVTKATSVPQYDEYGVEISRIDEEIARHQQIEQTQEVGRRR